jgi:hypothetical protein
VRLDPVFTFPLTFSPDDQDRYGREVRDALLRVATWVGMTEPPTPRFLDESSAGVFSVGQPPAADLVLVADLGGGTLDLSMGTGLAYQEALTTRPEWIGSLDFGGRFLLAAVCPEGAAEFALQSAIRRGEATAQGTFRSRRAVEGLVRLTSAISFYLGTMLHAHLTRSAAPDPPVRVFLLGKGWQFWRLTAAEGISREDFFKDRMRTLCEGLQRYLGAVLAPRTIAVHWANEAAAEGAKHAVAIGALTATETASTATVRLPAGVSLQQGKQGAPWHAPFGPGVRTGFRLDAHVKFDEADLEARLDAHRKALGAAGYESVFPPDLEFDAEALVRQALISERNAVGLGGLDAGHFRGPLQLLMENAWRRGL